MYKAVKFITKIPYKDYYTYYLFCTSIKSLIPIEVHKNNYDNFSSPSIYNTVGRIIKAFNATATKVRVYHLKSGIFYTYLTIQIEGSFFDINIGVKDGVEIAHELSIPIYVKGKIIERCGIKVTKELIKKALRS